MTAVTSEEHLCVVGKIFARIILTSLQTLAKRVYPDSQCGFRSGRGTVDMILCVRQLHEKAREQLMPLHVVFVDLTKAFDYVNREVLFTILKKVGCPPILLDLIKLFHEKRQRTAQVDGMISEPFPIVNGLKLGCVLVPTLFGIYFSVILREAMHNANFANPGVGLRIRFDANLFSTSRLKAKTKTTTLHVCETLYAESVSERLSS